MLAALLPLLEMMPRTQRIRRFLTLVILVVLAVTGRAVSQTAGQSQRSVIVVPVEGEIDFRQVALIRRALSEVDSIGASFLVLELNTPGGAKTNMDEFLATLELLRKRQVKVTAWIKRDGLSAGAIIAIACDRIYMASGARIGAATPVFLGGIRGVIEDEVYAKYISAIRARVRNIAKERNRWDPILAEAMVDPRLELVELRYRKKSDGVLRKKLIDRRQVSTFKTDDIEILSEKLVGEPPLTLTTQEAIIYGLADGRAETLDDLLRELDLNGAKVYRLTPNWSEELASFLVDIRYLLLIFAIALGVAAFKVPGTGVLEILALVLFVSFFAGSWLVGLAQWSEILLFALGVGLVLVELFLVPGIFIAGFAGLVAIVAAMFLSLQPFGQPHDIMERDLLVGNLFDLIIVLVLVIAISFLLSRFLPKIPFFSKLMLKADDDVGKTRKAATSEHTLRSLLGERGPALTDLRPAGRAELLGAPVDVVSNGRFLDRGTELVVLEVEGNRVIVGPANEDNSSGTKGTVAIIWLVFMVFIGLLVVIAEVFFPSAGVLSIIAGLLFVVTTFLSFQHGLTAGILFMFGIAVSLPAVIVFALRLLPNTPMGRKIILAGPTFDPDETRVREPDIESLVGSEGVAMTPLRPAGTVQIGSRRLDAITRGERIDAGTDVVVVAFELSQLVVAARRDGTTHSN